MSTSEPWRNPRPAPELEELRSRVPAKSMIPDWIRAWWPAIAWAILISILSTDSFSAQNTGTILERIFQLLGVHISYPQFLLVHHFVRKSAHFSEYFIFYVTLYRGIRGSRNGWHWSWAISAWVIAAVYSALDEIHQSFVASRTASPWDSLLDSTGAFVAMLTLFVIYWVMRKTDSGTPPNALPVDAAANT
jgi:VanZ family protein